MTRTSTVAAYAACAWGVIFALISFYWGSGGTTGLSTLGGSIEQRALAGDTVIFIAVWVTGVLKLIGAALALSLVRPWGQRLPRRPISTLVWIAAIGLILYGAVIELGNALTASKLIKPSTPIDWTALWWHLWLWDLSFLVWGILFAVAAKGRKPAVTV